MAAAAKISILMALTGLRTGNRSVAPADIAVTGAVHEEVFVTLSAGDNVITIPTGATKVLIVPPSDNTAALGIAGATSQTPIPIDPADWSFLALGASPALVINAASDLTSPVELQFA